ncbi:MAG: alpha/beta hydrolase [Nocardioides sp.]|uniref:alpha/beta fold hydrolase n=1 Tax=Nocardioides sp. TaxID=35761 RepID=UPI00326588C4
MTEPCTATSEYLRLGGLKAHFLHWGDPADPPVLMLHGLRSYAATWEPLAQELARDHWVLALDFRGRGGSGWDPERRYFTDAYVADVEEWVQQLGLRKFTIVGHSMGGTIGYVYAARHPDEVTRLVVEDIGPGSSSTAEGADRIRREMTSTPEWFASLEAARDFWRQTRPGMPDAAIRSRLEHTLVEAADRWVWRLDMAGIAEARLSGDPAQGIDLWACVESLECPTLVVRGAVSDFLPQATCAEMAARQPLLRWHTVGAAGHYVHDDNPEDYIEVVSQFCRRPTP